MISTKWIILINVIFFYNIKNTQSLRRGRLNSALQVFRTKCLRNYGCFSNGPPFYHPIRRPISLLPIDLESFDTKFYLYRTPEDRTLIQPNNASVFQSGYNNSLGLNIFIHGFRMQFDEDKLAATQNFVDVMMKATNKNIILVDWSANNREPYTQAIANGRVVAAQVAELIHFLVNNTELNPEKVHIIGHSLGTHLAGWVGERVPNLGRITGLDPAGPYFENSDPKVSLDYTDATFVDIIHTNAARLTLRGVGITAAIGHVDFYPNGGNNQPGCESTSRNLKFAHIRIPTHHYGSISDFQNLMCNHVRAIEFFLESAKQSRCKFIGHQCRDYVQYIRGNCASNKEVEMGLFTKKDSGIPSGSKFYLRTGRAEPYCAT